MACPRTWTKPVIISPRLPHKATKMLQRSLPNFPRQNYHRKPTLPQRRAKTASLPLLTRAVWLRKETKHDRETLVGLRLGKDMKNKARTVQDHIDALDDAVLALQDAQLATLAWLMAVGRPSRSEERCVGKECRSRWS